MVQSIRLFSKISQKWKPWTKRSKGNVSTRYPQQHSARPCFLAPQPSMGPLNRTLVMTETTDECYTLHNVDKPQRPQVSKYNPLQSQFVCIVLHYNSPQTTVWKTKPYGWLGITSNSYLECSEFDSSTRRWLFKARCISPIYAALYQHKL